MDLKNRINILNLNADGNIEQPTFVLCKRSGKRIGALDVIGDLVYSESFLDPSEFSFVARKGHCNKFDDIVNLRLIWIPEWDDYYEIDVDIEQSTDVNKLVNLMHLPEAELSQTNIYELHINDEEDINREDYDNSNGNKLYDPTNVRASILHRMLEKAVNYNIVHVDDTIKDLQRTFYFDDVSIYDALQAVAQEISCYFKFVARTENGKIVREISVYDMMHYCNDCGTRGENEYICQSCGSDKIKRGYGKDTPVFFSVDNVLDDIKFETDNDSIKNCFKLKSADEVMDVAIADCNPAGNLYLWYISNDMKKEMSENLSNKINQYNKEFFDCKTSYYFSPTTDAQRNHNIALGLPETWNTNSQLNITALNNLITKYSSYNGHNVLIQDVPMSTLAIPITGYAKLMEAYYNSLSMYYYLHDSLMPKIELSDTSAGNEYNKLIPQLQSLGIAVSSISIASAVTVDSTLLQVANAMVNSSYKVSIDGNASYDKNSHIWTGRLRIDNYNDIDKFDNDPTGKDFYVGGQISLTVTEDHEKYLKQLLKVTLERLDDNDYSITYLFFDMEFSYTAYNNGAPVTTGQSFTSITVHESALVRELRKYSLTSLLSLQNACNAALSILQERGDANPSAATYTNYYIKFCAILYAIEAEAAIRESETNTVNAIIEQINKIALMVNQYFNFEKYIGDDLMSELASFRREQTYTNVNFGSDGLSNDKIFNRAQEFISAAETELIKSAELQHSIKSQLKNLFMIDGFAPMVDYFECGNWLRVSVDEDIYKLRLLSYSIDFNDFENCTVEFSNVRNFKTEISDFSGLLNQVSSLSTNFNYLEKQAERQANITSAIIVESQNNSPQSPSGGGGTQASTDTVISRRWDSVTGTYDPDQLQIINGNLLITSDSWRSSQVGIGDFSYLDKLNGDASKNVYGINGEMIKGIIPLNDVLGIYSTNGTIMFNKNGLTIYNSNKSQSVEIKNDGSSLFKIKNGSDSVIEMNSSGELLLNNTKFTDLKTDVANNKRDIESLKTSVGAINNTLDKIIKVLTDNNMWAE